MSTNSYSRLKNVIPLQFLFVYRVVDNRVKANELDVSIRKFVNELLK